MNPCTLGWYLPLLVKDVPGALQPSDGDRNLPGPSSAAAPRPARTASSRPDTARPGPSSGGIRARGTTGASPDHHAADPATAAAVADPRRAARGRSSEDQQPQRRGGGGGGGGGGASWKDLDAKFRRDLPDDAYVGRLAYRGLVMRACPAIRTLDGVDASAKERDKAELLLASVLDRRKQRA